jgi:hypothetical protein
MEMMRQERKESEERAYVEMLLGSIFPDVGGVPEKSEAPDFLLAHGGRTIGIEVTELEVPPKDQRNRLRESMEDFITREAILLATERGFPPLSVSLFFNMADIALRKKWKLVASSVVDAVEKEIPEVGGEARLECSFRGVEPREVDLILVRRNEYAYRQDWKPVRASWVMQRASALFQEAIDKKNGKYPSYREKCDECWLILGVEGRRQSGAIRPDSEALEATYASRFERVFFVKRIDRLCHELKVRVNPHAAG